MTDLAAIIEAKYLALLDDAKEPDCPECGRKPMTPTQTIQALAGAVRWLASKNPPPPGGNGVGSGFKEDPDDGGS